MSEHCPTCGSTVEVHHGLEGTSHYRPVKDERLEVVEAEMDRLQHDYDEMADALQRESDDNFGQSQAAEARARRAEEALEELLRHPSDKLIIWRDFIRSALASHPDNPPPPPPPTPGLGRPETSGGKGKR